MGKIIAYTDGSALGNGQDGCACGLAYKVIRDGRETTGSGRCQGSTNNRMEMTAVLEAMRNIPEKDVPVEIYSDSRYVVETMNGQFSMKANKDIWRKLNAERMKFNNIRFIWVKGHDKNQHNIDVDRLAVEAAKRAME